MRDRSEASSSSTGLSGSSPKNEPTMEDGGGGASPTKRAAGGAAGAAGAGAGLPKPIEAQRSADGRDPSRPQDSEEGGAVAGDGASPSEARAVGLRSPLPELLVFEKNEPPVFEKKEPFWPPGDPEFVEKMFLIESIVRLKALPPPLDTDSDCSRDRNEAAVFGAKTATGVELGPLELNPSLSTTQRPYSTGLGRPTSLGAELSAR